MNRIIAIFSCSITTPTAPRDPALRVLDGVIARRRLDQGAVLIHAVVPLPREVPPRVRRGGTRGGRRGGAAAPLLQLPRLGADPRRLAAVALVSRGIDLPDAAGLLGRLLGRGGGRALAVGHELRRDRALGVAAPGGLGRVGRAVPGAGVALAVDAAHARRLLVPVVAQVLLGLGLGVLVDDAAVLGHLAPPAAGVLGAVVVDVLVHAAASQVGHGCGAREGRAVGTLAS
ncbi:hypothetical protein VP1G_10494 [Cytospora mali]|uniref:Uncharacterized protein n=1 Tax=Cytospora mali TaxID=578113 RepID=A0A194UME2_CYTMA|nr:hypothetical protein VP1G_10494 [Valsa mali var. pyri (nom. inval.)]